MERDEDELYHILSSLAIREILCFVRGRFHLSQVVRTDKNCLILAVIHNAPSDVLQRMHRVGEARLLCSRSEPSRYLQKRKRVEPYGLARGMEDMEVDGDSFLAQPSESCKRRCYADFFQATSAAALRAWVCAVCGRECGPMDEEIVLMKLNEVPNKTRLKPLFPHPGQQLTDGLLLAVEGIRGDEEGLMAEICSLCLRHQENNIRTGPPRLALSNGLWIGNIPAELEVLTFPEQLLISLLYPW